MSVQISTRPFSEAEQLILQLNDYPLTADESKEILSDMFVKYITSEKFLKRKDVKTAAENLHLLHRRLMRLCDCAKLNS